MELDAVARSRIALGTSDDATVVHAGAPAGTKKGSDSPEPLFVRQAMAKPASRPAGVTVTAPHRSAAAAIRRGSSRNVG